MSSNSQKCLAKDALRCEMEFTINNVVLCFTYATTNQLSSESREEEQVGMHACVDGPASKQGAGVLLYTLKLVFPNFPSAPLKLFMISKQTKYLEFASLLESLILPTL